MLIWIKSNLIELAARLLNIDPRACPATQTKPSPLTCVESVACSNDSEEEVWLTFEDEEVT